MTDHRLTQLENWLKQTMPLVEFSIDRVSGDASFRRYFRVTTAKDTYIAMDAPPDREDSQPFVSVARAMASIGLNVPRIIENNLAEGFLLLTDLGDVQYAHVLEPDTVEELYDDALAALLRLQTASIPPGLQLPDYNHGLLMREMALFSDWLLERHLAMSLDVSQQRYWQACCERLAESALAQPQVWVHRDYHSRNLMRTPESNPGILDFQDAVVGPVTYDLVSLLRDCYVAWPVARVEAWLDEYRQQLQSRGLAQGVDRQQFQHWCDWMGMQRHLKAAGIFARLNYRDGKPDYLKEIPRTLNYLVQAAGRYPELKFLHELVSGIVAQLHPETGRRLS